MSGLVIEDSLVSGGVNMVDSCAMIINSFTVPVKMGRVASTFYLLCALTLTSRNCTYFINM